MTISTTTNKNSYTGNGSTTAFAYTFDILADAEIQVYDGGTLQTLTTHYTVSGAGDAGGGTVTFVTAPANSNSVVLIRNTTNTQLVDYVANDPFPAETHETALDRLTMLVQDVQLDADAAFRFADTVTDAGTVTIDKNASDRGSKVLAFDSSGDLTATQELGESQGNWATATAYALRDIVVDSSNSNTYICITAHTSTGTTPISSNADAAKWTLIVNAAAVATSASNAATSETNAATSATNAATSETNAATSESNASTSEANAATSATNAGVSETNAVNSASAASTSETNAATSETNAAASETNAATSETNAASSETNASTSESNAATSASNAATSEANAASSASAASTSATNAATSETNAAAYATSGASVGVYYVTTGSSNAYVVAATPTITSYGSGGYGLLIKASFTNTGPATINVDAVGAKAIQKPDGSALGSGDITSGGIYHLTYDGTQFQLVGEAASTSSQININALDIFSIKLDDMADHSDNVLLTVDGFIDDFQDGTTTNNTAIDISDNAGNGITYDGTNDLWKNTAGATNTNSDKDYTTEANYKQQEWSNTLQSTSQATVTNGSATVTISSGTWPTYCANARISFDSGSTWYDIDTRTSGTSIELDSTATETTNSYDYVIRMSEFDSGVVRLSEAGTIANLAPGNTFAASSEFNYTYAVDELFDGITAGDNGWLTTSNDLNGAWASVDFGSATVINKIRVFQKGYSGQRTVSQFKIQRSTNNSTWVDVNTDAVVEGTVTLDGDGTNINYTTSEHDSFQGVTLDNSTAYRYYRIYVSANIADGDGSYVGFGEVEFHGPTGANVTSEYVSICDSEVQKTDTSSWSDINSGSVTETLNSQNVYYWLAFDSASSFGVGTEIKIFNSTDSVWRVIAKNNAGTWEYNNDSGNSATYTGSNAAVNDMLHAISQAISTQSGNRMTGTNLAAITDTQWEESGGWSLSTDNIVRGVTLYSNDSSQNPSVSQYRLNYDSASSNALLTNRSFGNTGMPATPGSNITTLVLMVIDKQVSGTPTYEVSSNGGTTWNTISSWDTESTMANSYVARLAETNVTADTGARTDPLFRIRNGGTGESYELKGVSLKYK